MDGNTRPALSRIYGLRTLAEPGFRRLVTRVLAGLAILVYAIQGLTQLLGLRSASLRWDFTQFHDAARELAAGRDPYAAFLAGCPGHQWCPGGYIFPPLLIELLRPLTGLDLVAASAVWLVLSHAFLLLSIILVWRTLRPWLGGAVGPLLLAATLLFLPLYQSLYFIQVGLLLLLLLALAAGAYVRAGDAAAGAWLATAAVLRVTPVLLAPALVMPVATPGDRRPRPPLAGPLVMLATGIGLVAILALLTPYTVEYFTAVLTRIGGGTPVLDNQSLPGLIDRAIVLFQGAGRSALGTAASAGAAGSLLGAGATLGVLGLTLAVTARAARRCDGGIPMRAGVFAAFLAALPVASSITWQHHLVTEPLVYALLAPLLLQVPGGGWSRWLVVASYPLMWVDRHVTDAAVIALGLANPSGLGVPPFLLLTAVNLMGMICLWAAALRLVSAAGERLGGEVAAG